MKKTRPLAKAILLSLFLIVFALNTSAQKVTLSFQNETFEKVLNSIKQQTGLSLVYSEQLVNLNRKVSINVNSIEVEDALKQLLTGTNLGFEIKNNKLYLVERKSVEPKNTASPSKKITGLVTDEKGDPIIGATIIEKSTKTGTTTDINGKFTINISKSTILAISYLGFVSKNYEVGEESSVKIKLEENSKILDEVVVLGYGSLKKRDITGAVSRVDMGDLSKASVRSFDEALGGRIAGVQVSSTDGQPGAQVNIVIRGNNSITQDNSPLYVIDGFPIEGFNNNLLSPSEIESVEVLKDASSTAIYGARGANGVIMITTKKGKEGPPVFTYDFSYGTQEKTNKIALLSTYDFVNLQLETFGSTKFTEMYLTPKNRTIEDYKSIEPIDFEDLMTRVAPMSTHSISVNGGTKQTKYSISGSTTNQDGIVVATNYKRYQGRLSVDQNVNKNFKVGLSISYSNVLQSGTSPSATYSVATSNLMYQAWGYRPVTASDVNLAEVLYDPDIPSNSNYIVNPLQSALNEFRQNSTNNIIINAYAEYQLNKFLKFRTSGGINNSLLTMEAFNNSKTNSGGPNSVFKQGVNGSLTTRQTDNWLNENILTFSNLKKIHDVNIIAGITASGTNNRFYNFSANQIPNEALGMNGLREGVPQNIQFTSSASTLASFLSRINYSYRSKYLFTASMRADGSSRFSDGNKWSYFPSGSFAWRLSSEEFMRKIEFVTDAKFRLSHGLTGNNRVGDFSYLSQLSSPISSIYAFDNNPANIGSNVTALGNEKLKWETTAQTNFGLDLSMIKNSRITLSVDLYRKITKDLLLNAQLPGSIGFTSVFKNIGKVKNQGVEFAIKTINISTKDITWSTSFNIAFNQSKILQLTQDQQALPVSVRWEQNYSSLTPYIAKLNEPLSSFYGLSFDGLYQYNDFNIQTGNIGIKYVLKDDVPTNGNPASAIQPGDLKYKDLNGDKIIDSRDYTIIGNALPIHIGGFTNNFNYKNFDLNIFFQWSYGNQVINANRYTFESGYRQNLNQYVTYANRWSPSNQNTNIPRYTVPTNYQYSSRVVEDASYLRLKTVSVGYSVPEKFLKFLKAKALRFALSGQNLITWTKYSGLDPEVSVRNGALTQGFDFSPYPRARTITFNLKVQF